VRTDYEPLAARYDEDRERWPFPRDEIVDELLASRESIRVLDLGCGTGRWLTTQRDVFGDRRVRWVGADPSRAMLAEAAGKAMPLLVRARAEAIPASDGRFDYIVSSYCFHHFNDKERALDEIRRVLTARGVFRLNNIEPAASTGWWLYEFFPEAREIDASRFWPAARIGEALESREFAVDIALDSAPREISAAEALAEAERRVVSQLALLDEPAYAKGMERLRAAARATGATVTSNGSSLCLTARRVASAL
jgi:SAM-dependent methyltransferase